MRRRGFVYFVRCKRHIKIGFSANVPKRVEQLRTDATASPWPGSPRHVTVLGLLAGSMDEEKSLHSRFAAQRVRGEWFKENGAVAEYLASAPLMPYDEATFPKTELPGVTVSVRLPFDLHKRVSIARAQRGMKLRELFIAALERELKPKKGTAHA